MKLWVMDEDVYGLPNWSMSAGQSRTFSSVLGDKGRVRYDAYNPTGPIPVQAVYTWTGEVLALFRKNWETSSQLGYGSRWIRLRIPADFARGNRGYPGDQLYDAHVLRPFVASMVGYDLWNVTFSLDVDASPALEFSTLTDTAPIIFGVPTIDNQFPQPGDILTASPAPVSGVPTPVRTWDWTGYGTEMGNQYEVSELDIGNTILVRQIETNVVDTVSALSLPTEPVNKKPEPTAFSTNTTGTRIFIDYDEVVRPGDVTPSDYVADQNGTPHGISSVTTEGQRVTLEVSGVPLDPPGAVNQPPVLLNMETNDDGTQVYLDYNEIVLPGDVMASDFDLEQDGTPIPVSGVSISNRRVTLFVGPPPIEEPEPEEP